MNIALWIVAGLLAAAFLMAGTMKIAVPKEKLLSTMAWAEAWPPPRLKALGVVEVLGAIGLILPRALNIAPVLTPVAAAGCVIVMAGGGDHPPDEGLRGHRHARWAARPRRGRRGGPLLAGFSARRQRFWPASVYPQRRRRGFVARAVARGVARGGD